MSVTGGVYLQRNGKKQCLIRDVPNLICQIEFTNARDDGSQVLLMFLRIPAVLERCVPMRFLND